MCPPAPAESLALASPSSSSKNTRAGAVARARANRPATAFSLSPTYLLTSSAPWQPYWRSPGWHGQGMRRQWEAGVIEAHVYRLTCMLNDVINLHTSYLDRQEVEARLRCHCPSQKGFGASCNLRSLGAVQCSKHKQALGTCHTCHSL